MLNALRILLATIVIGLALAAPASAQGPGWIDGTSDGGLAPDIHAVFGAWGTDGNIGGAATLSQRGWYVGDRVFLYLDTDMNAATGDGGAEYMIGYERHATGDTAYLGRWLGNGYAYDTPQRTLIAQPGAGQIVLGAHRSELGSPSGAVRYWFASVYRTGTISPTDRAPDVGMLTVHESAVGALTGPGATTPAPAPRVRAPQVRRRPALRGTARVGRRLRVTAGRWSGATSVRYRWVRNGKAIRGATRRSYRVRRADRGRRIACRVTAINSGGRRTVTTASRRVR